MDWSRLIASFCRTSIDASSNLAEQTLLARRKLVEQLADLDDEVMETLLKNADVDPASFAPELIKAALRRATIQMTGVPTLVGSSLRNRGVQPLLDAVLDFLPSPEERPPPPAVDDDGEATQIEHDPKAPLVAQAFKVYMASLAVKLLF